MTISFKQPTKIKGKQFQQKRGFFFEKVMENVRSLPGYHFITNRLSETMKKILNDITQKKPNSFNDCSDLIREDHQGFFSSSKIFLKLMYYGPFSQKRFLTDDVDWAHRMQMYKLAIFSYTTVMLTYFLIIGSTIMFNNGPICTHFEGGIRDVYSFIHSQSIVMLLCIFAATFLFYRYTSYLGGFIFCPILIGLYSREGYYCGYEFIANSYFYKKSEFENYCADSAKETTRLYIRKTVEFALQAVSLLISLVFILKYMINSFIYLKYMEVNKSKDGRLKNTILNSCCIQATISKYVENPYVYDKHETFEVEDIIEENTKPFFENVKKTKSNINSNNKKDGEAKDKIKNVKNSGDNNKNDKETKYTINNHLETKNNEITYEQDTNDDEKNLVLTNELSSTITSTQSEKDSLLKKISVN